MRYLATVILLLCAVAWWDIGAQTDWVPIQSDTFYLITPDSLVKSGVRYVPMVQADDLDSLRSLTVKIQDLGGVESIWDQIGMITQRDAQRNRLLEARERIIRRMCGMGGNRYGN